MVQGFFHCRFLKYSKRIILTFCVVLAGAGCSSISGPTGLFSGQSGCDLASRWVAPLRALYPGKPMGGLDEYTARDTYKFLFEDENFVRIYGKRFDELGAFELRRIYKTLNRAGNNCDRTKHAYLLSLYPMAFLSRAFNKSLQGPGFTYDFMAKHVKVARDSGVKQAPVAELSPEVVRDAQRILALLGVNPGIPDGRLHDKTKRAVALFQSDRGLPVSGLLDAKTIGELKVAEREYSNVEPNEPNSLWAFAMTNRRVAHGAAAGRTRLEAHGNALRKCEAMKLADPTGTGKCRVVHLGEIDSSTCVSFVMRYFTWEKYVAFATSPEEAYQRAYRACGSNSSHCKSARLVGPRMEYTYCGKDFK